MYHQRLAVMLSAMLSYALATPVGFPNPAPASLSAVDIKGSSREMVSPVTKRETIEEFATPECYYYNFGDITWQYYVILTDDGTPTTGGWDAAGECGSGFLDNIHGNGVIATTWQCAYQTGASSSVASFWTVVDTSDQITNAFNEFTENSFDWSGCIEWDSTDVPGLDLTFGGAPMVVE